ncbi:site-specific DNA-methyltransferase [bacterium]|nr:site-specific DNA-methyltransferase [bacterium]
MPTLDWIGKKAVEKHHEEVPFHLLKCDNSLSVGDPGSGNLIVQGDNLVALKALLPYYAGKVDCIYIDPPYNTGAEGWIYNDNVNSPEIKEWLGKVVGAEAEDLSRHDKWLCMMLPRISTLYKMLSEDGQIFVSIDDHELDNLIQILDIVFGRSRQVGILSWYKKRKGSFLSKELVSVTEYVVVYRKGKKAALYGGAPNEEESQPILKRGNRTKVIKFPAKTVQTKLENGAHKVGVKGTGTTAMKLLDEILVQDGVIVDEFRLEGPFVWGQEMLDEELSRGGVCVINTENFQPRVFRKFAEGHHKGLSSFIDGRTMSATNDDAFEELREIFHTDRLFAYSKPKNLVKHLIRAATNYSKDSIVLDSFAGSGTTAHAVMQLNKEDGGNRKFILVEMDQNICENITAERVKRVALGYKNQKGQQVEGLGGGFRYCTLGETLFDADGEIRKEVKFSDLARHIYLTETGEPLPKQNNGRSPLLGVHHGTAYYLLYNGILGDKTAQGGNVLTRAVLAELPEHEGPKVIYGTGCRLGKKRLDEMQTQFRQIPGKVVVR